MSKRSKFPITQRVQLEVFDKVCHDSVDVMNAVTDHYREYVLGRVSFIVRTLAPDTCTVPTPGLVIDGIPVDSVSKDGDRIQLNSADPGARDLLDKDYDSDLAMMEYLCWWLEQRHVSPAARFIPYKPPYDDIKETALPDIPDLPGDEGEDMNDEDLEFPEDMTTEDTIHAIVSLVNDAYDRDELEIVAGHILAGASRLLAVMCADNGSESFLDIFSDQVRKDTAALTGKPENDVEDDEKGKGAKRTFNVTSLKNLPS